MSAPVPTLDEVRAWPATVDIETGHLVARTGSALATIAHVAAELLSYDVDGPAGEGDWSATVAQARGMLDDLDDYAHDLSSVLADDAS